MWGKNIERCYANFQSESLPGKKKKNHHSNSFLFLFTWVCRKYAINYKADLTGLLDPTETIKQLENASVETLLKNK